MWKKLFRPVKAKERTGFCLCGCGKKTPLAKVTRNERGDVRGYPVRYLYGHNTKDPEWRKGVPLWTRKTNWNGGKTIHQGYVLRHKRTFTKKQYEFLKPMFLKYNKRGVYVPEHRALMALKENRLLLSNEFVRHLDGNRSNNSKKNLLLGTAKDNYLDHDTARKEVIRLKNENGKLKDIIWRLHGGKNAKILWEGKL